METDDRQGVDEGVHGSTAPGDLGSTDPGMRLTAGGTGTELGTGSLGWTEARDLEDMGFDTSTSGAIDPDAALPEDTLGIGPETGNTEYRTE